MCDERREEKENKNTSPDRSITSGAGHMLKQVLGELLRLEGVSAVVVVGRDGFVIESVHNGKIDAEALAAMASAGMGALEAMGAELGKGRAMQVLVELEDGPVLLSPVSDTELIAIVGEKNLNVGRIRYELKKSRERVVAAL